MKISLKISTLSDRCRIFGMGRGVDHVWLKCSQWIYWFLELSVGDCVNQWGLIYLSSQRESGTENQKKIIFPDFDWWGTEPPHTHTHTHTQTLTHTCTCCIQPGTHLWLTEDAPISWSCQSPPPTPPPARTGSQAREWLAWVPYRSYDIIRSSSSIQFGPLPCSQLGHDTRTRTHRPTHTRTYIHWPGPLTPFGKSALHRHSDGELSLPTPLAASLVAPCGSSKQTLG